MSNWIKWCNGGGMVHKDATIHPTATVGEWAIVGEGARVGECARVGEGARVGEWANMPSALTPKGHCISHEATKAIIDAGILSWEAKS